MVAQMKEGLGEGGCQGIQGHELRDKRDSDQHGEGGGDRRREETVSKRCCLCVRVCVFVFVMTARGKEEGGQFTPRPHREPSRHIRNEHNNNEKGKRSGKCPRAAGARAADGGNTKKTQVVRCSWGLLRGERTR